MRVVYSPQKIQRICLQLKKQHQTIAVVPTMGFLHEGHLSLLRVARQENDVVIMTLFVNPTQFGPSEDLKKYPRDLKGDLQKARKEGVDIVFCPSARSLYPQDFETYIEVTKSTKDLCGQSRPLHFRGVATIVAKLFHLTFPNTAYFGLKDYQQYRVICRMVEDLNFSVKIIGCPLVREPDGLAMSSRNTYLTSQEREAALSLSRGLIKIKKEVKKGNNNLKKLLFTLKKEIRSEPLVKIDYIKCVDAQTLQPLCQYQKGKTLFAVAAFVGKTRLIDNVVV